MKFDLGHKENFPEIGAQLMDDGEVLLTFNSYPASAMMAVPLNVAVDFAKHILDLQKLQKQMEDCDEFQSNVQAAAGGLSQTPL